MNRISICLLTATLATGCATADIRKEFYDSGTLRAEWRYENGVKQGESVLYDEEGNPFFEVYLEQGKMQGVSREYEYFAGRKKLSVLYKCQDDLCKGYDSHGEFQLSEIRFKNGFAHGPAKYFHESGELETRVTFANGWREGEATQHYKNGKVAAKRTFVKGREQGEVQYFYKNGQLKKSAMYKDGNPNGTVQTFYKDGQLRSTSTIRQQGKHFIHLNSKSYYPNGQLKTEDITAENGGIKIHRRYSEKGVLLKENDFTQKMSRKYDESGKLISEKTLKKR